MNLREDWNSGLNLLVRALRHRNYRLFFGGQSISLLGTWMQYIAMSWLVYRLTGSPLLLGTVSFCNQIPTFLLGPLAGMAADHLSRFRIILTTQILSMLQAVLLAFLVLSGRIEVWHLFGLSLLLGVVNAFDASARQSFIVDLLEERDDLNNAIALNSLMFNAARLVGPSIAGIIIAMVGEGVCFSLNAVSFLAVIAALLAMRIRPQIGTSSSRSGLKGLWEGYVYAYRTPEIRNALLLIALVSLVGLPYTVLMPVFAADILEGGAHTLGFLMSAIGVGAICGSTFLATRSNAASLEKNIPPAAALLGLALLAFSQVQSLWVAVGILFFAGLGMIVQIASTNTLIQVTVDDDKRGRVMSLYNMSFLGMAPFGNLLAGALADKFGAPVTVLVGGLVCIIGAFLFWYHLPEQIISE